MDVPWMLPCAVTYARPLVHWSSTRSLMRSVWKERIMWLVEWGRASTCIGSCMDVSALSSLHPVMHTGEFVCPSRHIDSRSVVLENECLRLQIGVLVGLFIVHLCIHNSRHVYAPCTRLGLVSGERAGTTGVKWRHPAQLPSTLEKVFHGRVDGGQDGREGKSASQPSQPYPLPRRLQGQHSPASFVRPVQDMSYYTRSLEE